jgi:peptidyl-prolyl cis-trans isomerase C
MNVQELGRRRLLVAAAVVALVALVVGIFFATRTTVPDDAAFVYGDDVVTKSDLDKRIDALQALYGIAEPKGAKERDTFRRTAAKAYAVTLVLDHEAQKLDIKVSDKKARDLLDRYIDVQFGSRDEFVRALGNAGTSERAVLVEIRRQAATMEMRRKIAGKVTVNDAALKVAFDRRKAELAIPEQRQLQNIVVPTKGEADGVATRLRAGESVAALASEVSIDEASNKSGGDLGFLSQDQLETAVGQAAFGVAKGQVYGPAKGEHGWNVGIVADIRAPQPADFAVMGEAFRTQLVQEQEDARWRTWLTKVIRAADVHYAKAYRPADPDAPPPLGQSSPIQSSPTQ